MTEFRVEWLVEGRVIHIHVSGEYTLEIVRQGVDKVKSLLKVGTAPVHVVWDLSGITKVPKNLRELVDEFRDLRYHPKGGWITLVSRSVMLSFAGQIATVFLGANYRPVTSFDEAVATLIRVDPTLAERLIKPALHQAHET